MDTPRPIGFWLKLVDRLIDEQFQATLEEHGVTRRQWQLLNVLHAQNATIEQLDAAVAPFLGADETSAENLTELVESEWVESAAEGYSLTERGRAALDRLSQVVATQRTAIAQGITPDEYQLAVSVLERMAANLGYEG